MAENILEQDIIPPGNNADPAIHRASQSNTTMRPTPRFNNGHVMTTSRDFEGATPGIGGILALRSENIVKKVNYDVFVKNLESTL